MFGNKLSRGIPPNIKTPSLKQNTAGMAQNKPDSALGSAQAVRIENMHAVQEGVWSADMAGYTIINQNKTAFEAGAAIDGMIWYPDSAGVNHLYFACNTKLKEVDLGLGTASNIDAAAGYTVGAKVEMTTFETGGIPYLYSVDGHIATPRKWNGAAASDAGGWPVTDGINNFTKPKLVGEYQGRLVTGNFNGFHSHIILSDFQAPDTYTSPVLKGTDYYIAQVGNEAGQQLRGFRRLPIPRANTEILVCAKDRAIYTLTGNSALDSDPTPFDLVEINDEYGAFNNRSMIRVGGDVFLFGEKGILSYTTASTSGDMQPLGLNQSLVRDTLDILNLSATDQCWAIHLSDRMEIWFAFPTGSSTQADTILVYRYPTPGDPTSTPKWSMRTSAGVFKPSYGVKVNRNFYTGFYNGTIGQMFNSSLYDTVGIPWKYQYGKLAYGNEKQFKQVLDSEATFKMRSDQTITIQSDWSGGGNNDRFVNSIPVASSVSGALWNHFNWDTAFWGAQQELYVPFKCPGNGKYHQLTLSGTTNASGPVYLGLTPTTRYGTLARTGR